MLALALIIKCAMCGHHQNAGGIREIAPSSRQKKRARANNAQKRYNA